MSSEVIRLVRQPHAHIELAESLLAPGDALKNHARIGSLPDGLHLGGHMREHAVLCEYSVSFDDLPQGIEHGLGVFHNIRHRVDADDRVARAVGQPLVNLCHNRGNVIPRVVGLETRGKPPRQTHDIVGVYYHGYLPRRASKVGVRCGLGHSSGHFGGEVLADALDVNGGCVPVQQEFPELRDGLVPDAPVNRRVHDILNDPGDDVILVGDHGVFAQVAERQLVEHLLGGDPLPHGWGGDARKHVFGAQFTGPVQDPLDRAECIRCPEKDGLQLRGCFMKKTLPGGGTPGTAAPREGMDEPPAACLGIRRPPGSGCVRR